MRQQLAAVSVSDVEDSIFLRVFVQSLVIVGIIATDVAASTFNSVWAVPLSILGAIWSGYNRRRRNIPVKLCLAIAMLVVLVLFLGRLLGQLNDSRIMLAELLIQLQVLHSFDLPRRKDLGYSAVIGLILLGVAATLSQTSLFGVFLLLFLAIALPVLVLDYRSRLGLISLRLKRMHLAPKRLGTVLLVVLGLGLLIFALMPRLPGYQLRTFPVSSQIDFAGKFDPRQVINPGYVSPGSGQRMKLGNGSGELSQAPGDNPSFDPTFYYGFNREINQNLQGTLKPKVVMRVRSQSAGFWRVVAFDQYTGQGWKISRNDQVEILKRPAWSYQFYLPMLSALGDTKEIVQTYSIVSEFPNLIPALTQPKHLYFPTQEIGLDPEAGLRSPVRLEEGITYTVISDVPYRDRTQLRQAATDYSTQIRKFYLQVPPAIAGKIRQRAQQLLATSPKPITSPYEQALFLAQVLKQKYTLQANLPRLSKHEDLVESFLFKLKGGEADHFSTVLTVMLRSIGIPARLVTGFGTGQFNPFTGMYVVKNIDAYAMTEVYFPQYGWFTFDPIPGHDLLPPSVEVNQTFTLLQQFWNWIAGWLPSPVTGALTGIFVALVSGIGKLLHLFSGGWQGWFVGGLVLIGCGILGWLAMKGWRTWRYQRWLAKLPPMERLYQQMLTWLALRGVHRHPAQTPLEYANQLHKTYRSTGAEVVTDISQAYMRWRYGRQHPNLNDLKNQFRSLKKSRLKIFNVRQ